jgi:uncharacterized protein (DUF433 family)
MWEWKPRKADEEFWDEVRRAQRMSPTERLFAGAELFEYASEITRAGIRHQFPELDADGVEQVLRERLDLARRLEEQRERQRRSARLKAGAEQETSGGATVALPSWKYLAREPNSRYKQLRVQGRGVFARTLYGHYVNEESPMTPEEIAADYGIPVEAVWEAIRYCEADPPEIREDFEAEEAAERARGQQPRPPHAASA